MPKTSAASATTASRAMVLLNMCCRGDRRSRSLNLASPPSKRFQVRKVGARVEPHPPSSLRVRLASPAAERRRVAGSVEAAQRSTVPSLLIPQAYPHPPTTDVNVSPGGPCSSGGPLPKHSADPSGLRPHPWPLAMVARVVNAPSGSVRSVSPQRSSSPLSLTRKSGSKRGRLRETSRRVCRSPARTDSIPSKSASRLS